MSTPPTTAAATPTILDFRLTFLWVETILDIVSGAADLAELFTFLRKSNRYGQVFEAVLAGKSQTGLEAPWQKHKKQFFWKYYLAGAALDLVSGTQAWQHLVPLRIKPPFAVKDWKHGHVMIEGFYYPHGLALAATFTVVSSLTLDQTVELAYAIKDGEERFLVERDRLQASSTLESLADDAFKWMRDSLGKGVKPGKRRDVFSIFTVVKAVPMIPFEPSGQVHRAFQAVTEWSAAPETASLRPILEVQVPVKGTRCSGKRTACPSPRTGCLVPWSVCSNETEEALPKLLPSQPEVRLHAGGQPWRLGEGHAGTPRGHPPLPKWTRLSRRAR